MRNKTIRYATIAGAVLTTAVPLGLGSIAGAATYTCEGHAATKVGTNASETINGTAGPDVIVGLGGNDTINGLGGNDIICGKEGADRLYGGDGNDRLWGERDQLVRDSQEELALNGDTLDGGAGNDVIVPGYDDRAHSQHCEVITYAASPVGITTDISLNKATGWGTDQIVSNAHTTFVGSAHDDHIRGTLGNDVLESGAGNDIIEGRAGRDEVGDPVARPSSVVDRDTVYLGSGDDLFVSKSGTHKVLAGDGNDFVSVTGDGRVYGEAGNDDIDFRSARNPAAVTASGGPGRDFVDFTGLRLGTSDTLTLDALAGRISFSTVPGASGQLAGFEDYLTYGGFTLRFNGSDLKETIQHNGPGGHLDATMNGGDDVVYGVTRQPDHIDGGPGNDYADGRGGADTFVSIERR